MRSKIHSVVCIVMFVFIVVSSILTKDAFGQTPICNYYASPNGSGNGLSPSSPFKISNFWSVAAPGRILCLLDGTYADASSMINPPENLNGTQAQPIKITAINDGQVRINGQAVREPIHLRNNDWFVIEGVDAYNSSCNVVELARGADNNILRRVIAWDAKVDGNCIVYEIWNNTGNLIEDAAGFGSGRKIVEWYDDRAGSESLSLTIRRMWGQWSHNTITGPKLTFSYMYETRNAVFENLIGTWDETAMGGSSVNQPFAIIGADQISDGESHCLNTKILGSISYVRSADKVNSWIGGLMGARAADCIEFKDDVVYIAPGTHSQLTPLYAAAYDTGQYGAPPVGNRKLTNITTIATGSNSIGGSGSAGWTQTNNSYVSSVASAPNIWNGTGSNGARVCHQYVNGTLTSAPLWPWPMNQRIINAMLAAGKTPVDVTQTMEQIFGPIPSECQASSSTTGLNPPSNLAVVAQ